MPYVITGLIILLGAWLFFWLIAIDGVRRNVLKLQKKRLEIYKRINKLLAKLARPRRFFLFKQNTYTREVFDSIIEVFGSYIDIANVNSKTLEKHIDILAIKNDAYNLLIYLQEQPFEYWWLVEKLNIIYASCEEALDIMTKIRRYRKPLPEILKNIPDRNNQYHKPKGGLKNVVQQN
jgi:hypothetical protein